MELGIDGFFFSDAAAYVGVKESTFGYHVWALKTIRPAEYIGKRPVFARTSLDAFKRAYKPYHHLPVYAAGQRLYNGSQAAKRIGVSRQRFAQWVKDGRVIADVIINGRGRYTEKTIDALMTEIYTGKGKGK